MPNCFMRGPKILCHHRQCVYHDSHCDVQHGTWAAVLRLTWPFTYYELGKLLSVFRMSNKK